MHLEAAVAVLVGHGVPVAVHAITDGRDVAPKSAEGFLNALSLPDGATIATVCGRYFALDRDNRWERVARAYDAMVRASGGTAPNALAAVKAAYAADQTDEFISPTVIGTYAGMKDGDGIFMLNYRADRAREILAAMGDPAFDGFNIHDRPAFAGKLGMVDYSKAHDAYMTTVFPKQSIKNTLGEWVAKAGLRQFRVAETEKYPHVTFFLNGGVEVPEVGEDRQMPKSPDVATYDLQPEMSSTDVTELLVGAIKQQYDLIVVNYANPDMVGHTGIMEAAIQACEAVDKCVKQVINAALENDYTTILIADHGNCETMINEDGSPHTAHTTNPVPVILIDKQLKHI